MLYRILPMKLTDKNFKKEVLESDVPVLVDFYANWCAPCRNLSPIITEIAREFDGRAKVGKINVDENPKIAKEFDVDAVPTLLYFQDGELVERLVGVISRRTIAVGLNALLGA
jgi:thioredoxin 1